MNFNRDVIGEVASFATASDCLSLSVVCRLWFDAVSTAPAVWRTGGQLSEFEWPIGDRVPSLLQRAATSEFRCPLTRIRFRAQKNIPHRAAHSAQHLVIGGFPDLREITAQFLNGSQLTSLTLTDLPNVKTIGNWFLYQCASLTSVDLSGLTAVTSIGDDFLSGSDRLSSVDLTGMTALTSIGDFFLIGCTALRSVDFSKMTSLTSIGEDFLNGCESLTSVDLSGMTAVTSIGPYFLSECRQLGTLDLSEMTAVTQVGDDFLYGCDSLVSVRCVGVVKDSVDPQLQ